MSVAVKCDRCGKLFVPPKYREGKRIRLSYEDINDAEEETNTYYDLCSECDEKFKKWIKNEEKE